MNRQRLLTILRDPSQLDNPTDMSRLKELVEEYPYFPVSYALITKILQKEQSIYFDKYLKMAACYAGDREVLYDFLNKSEAVTVPEVIEPPIELEEQNQLKNEVVEAPISEETHPEIETVQPPIIEETPKETSEKVKSLDLPGIMPLYAYDYFAYQGRKDKPKAIEEDLEENVSQPEVKVPTSSDRLTFSSWFTHIHKKSEPVIPESTKTLTPQSANSQTTLIDQFIQSEPRIKPKSGTFFSPENMAKKSASEYGVIATETLAEIYIRQGLLDKAIEIFQILMEKNPQKSSYFAVRINELKTKQT